jgi:hypothetical protein
MISIGSSTPVDTKESVARLQRIASLIDDLRRKHEPNARRVVMEEMRKEIQAAKQPGSAFASM